MFFQVSGRFSALKDEKGFYFIDRDGELFKPILNYLRKGVWDCPSHLNSREVLEEASFYGIDIQQYSTLTDASIPILQKQKQKEIADELKKEFYKRNKTLVDKLMQIILSSFADLITKGNPLVVAFLPDFDLETMEQMCLQRFSKRRWNDKRIPDMVLEWVNRHPKTVKNSSLVDFLRENKTMFLDHAKDAHQLTLTVQEYSVGEAYSGFGFQFGIGQVDPTYAEGWTVRWR